MRRSVLGVGVCMWVVAGCGSEPDIRGAAATGDLEEERTRQEGSESDDAAKPTADDDGDGDELDGGADGDEAADTRDIPPCETFAFEQTALPPKIMLVLDRSRSMVSETWDHDLQAGTPAVTRWSSLHAVTTFLVDEFDDSIDLGMVMFPGADAEDYPDQRSCLVADEPDVPASPGSGATILDHIPPADSDDSVVFGATPAAAGIATAREHLAKIDPTLTRAIVLVTDGAPNCDTSRTGLELFSTYDANVEAEVAAALDDGIQTYVVGIDIVDDLRIAPGSPGINTFEALNTLAARGGVDRPGPEAFYNAANEGELRGALADIAAQVVSCELAFDTAPQNPAGVSVEIGGTSYPQITDCSSEDGWQFVGGDFRQIVLCGAACDGLERGVRANVEFACVVG